MKENNSVQPKEIEEKWSKATYLDKGDDSEVRRLGGLVIKRYPEISESQLKLYQETIAMTATVLDGRKIDTPIGQSILRVNPIYQVIESSRDFTMYAISPFIEGLNMHHLLLKRNHGVFNKFEGLLEKISEELIATTRIKGIQIIPYNVLLVNQEAKGMRQLVITDVASYVSRIVRI